MEKSSSLSLTQTDVDLAKAGTLSARLQSIYTDLTLEELQSIIEAGEYTLVLK